MFKLCGLIGITRVVILITFGYKILSLFLRVLLTYQLCKNVRG